MALQKVLALRDPAGDRVYEEPVVGIPAQGVLGMKDVAQPPVDLYQLVFAQESFNPVTPVPLRDASLAGSTGLG